MGKRRWHQWKSQSRELQESIHPQKYLAKIARNNLILTLKDRGLQQQMLNQERQFKHRRRSLWCFNLPSLQPLPSTGLILKTVAQISGGGSWLGREQRRSCSQWIVFIFFDFLEFSPQELMKGKSLCFTCLRTLSRQSSYTEDVPWKLLKNKRTRHCCLKQK